MMALASVWLGVGCFILALAMVVYPPEFTEWTMILLLQLGAPLALCFSGMVLWAHRKDTSGEPGIAAQRRQAKVSIGLTLAGIAIVYVIFFVLANPPLSPLEKGG